MEIPTMRFPAFLLLLLFFFLHLTVGQTPSALGQNGPIANLSLGILQLKVGLLFCNSTTRLRTLFGFGQSAPAITLALRKATQDGLINPNNVNISFAWYMDNCLQKDAVGYATKLVLDDHVDAIIGPACLSSALIAGFVSSFYSIPIFVWGATISPDFSNNSVYATMVNVNTDVMKLSLAIQMLLSMFQWKEIALVYTQDLERQVCSKFQSVFENLINENDDVTIVFKQRMVDSEEGMKATLGRLMNRSRIVVTCFDLEVNRRAFLLALSSMGIAGNSEYVFLNAQLRSQGMLQQISAATTNGTMVYDKIWVDKNMPKDGRDEQAKQAARLFFVIDLENSSAQMEQFNMDMYAEFGKYPFFCDANCTMDPNSPSQYARSLYDATYLFSMALNRTFGEYGYSKEAARNASILVVNSFGSFQGQTGKVIMDRDGNRIPTYLVTGLDPADNPTVFISVNVSNNTVNVQKKYDDEANTLWATRGGKMPLYKPICGYTGTECPQNFTLYIIVGGGLILVFLCGTILGIVFAVREKMREQRRLAQESLIAYQELKSIKEGDKAKSMRSIQSSQSGSTSKLTMDSKHIETEGHCFNVYQKQVVFGKKYIVRVRLNNEDLILLRKIRQMDHDNLNKLLGVCVDGPILLAIWKHCQRGSLKDVIAKEQYVADSFVMFALIRDLTNGLIALHQSFVGLHGHLTSENCLINDRWQLKISDYGLAMIHESQPTLKKKLLWTAPELLRDQNRLGTLPGDTYSFGIICSELINKETVWNGVTRDDEIEDIIYRLKRSNNALPYRPQLNQREEVNANLYHLVRDCWSENPTNRPKMDLVRSLLRQMIPNSSQNLMDYVFSMLEQYATSLEQEVEERTKELFEEKRKSDILLYRMLPREVAEKLKLGEAIEPESFDQSTIFFSDVVSFTTLASKCSPLQVVNLLNNLYTTFDNIIDSHDAYKVETIGDGYLVCSGIPKRNGHQHVKEIAELSFAFLRSVANFRIDHLPGERVNLRIGFHTGPAVAGVVGLTMPRYCLFGDAVNTASRMESSGRPGQIHISATANQYLTNIIGGYMTEPRGETIIKGKGVMETFWLLGYQGDMAMSRGGGGGGEDCGGSKVVVDHDDATAMNAAAYLDR